MPIDRPSQAAVDRRLFFRYNNCEIQVEKKRRHYGTYDRKIRMRHHLQKEFFGQALERTKKQKDRMLRQLQH